MSVRQPLLVPDYMTGVGVGLKSGASQGNHGAIGFPITSRACPLAGPCENARTSPESTRFG